MGRCKSKHKKLARLPPTVLAKRLTWWKQRGFRFRPLTEERKEKEQQRHSIAEFSCGKLRTMSNQTSNTGCSSVPHTESYTETVLSSPDLPSEVVSVSPIPNNGTISPTQLFEASARDMELIDEGETIAASDTLAVVNVLCSEYDAALKSACT